MALKFITVKLATCLVIAQVTVNIAASPIDEDARVNKGIYSESTENKLNGNHRLKLVGGFDVSIERVPYQVLMLLKRDDGYTQCGGSLISARYVLTAGHCLNGVRRIFVRVGSSNTRSGGTVIVTARYLVHPLFNSHTLDYDVGVVDLGHEIELDGKYSSIIQLPAEGTMVPAYADLLVSGWGSSSDGGPGSDTLKYIRVPIVSHTDCQKAYGAAAITNRMFCAGIPRGGLDACKGDSGGPAVISGPTLVGVVSFGEGCGLPNMPGVYLNVAMVREWIRSVTGV